jgi:hypothetical protein
MEYKWYWHAESECYVVMDSDDEKSQAQIAQHDLMELGPATMSAQVEAARLHDRLKESSEKKKPNFHRKYKDILDVENLTLLHISNQFRFLPEAPTEADVIYCFYSKGKKIMEFKDLVKFFGEDKAYRLTSAIYSLIEAKHLSVEVSEKDEENTRYDGIEFTGKDKISLA